MSTELLKSQYAWVLDSRSTLFEYCETISPNDFLREHPGFGRGSIRNLLVHIANIYEYWIGKHLLQRDQIFTPFNDVDNMQACRALYQQIDLIMHDGLATAIDRGSDPITIERNGVLSQIAPAKIITHAFTHEFHHKGQILSMSRQMGYTPVDTDLIQ